MKIKLLLLFVVMHGSLLAQDVEVAFIIPEKDLVPEGITYNKNTKTFYVGSIHKKKVISIDDKRKIKDYIISGQDGMGEVIGIHVDHKRRHLWVCNNEGENIAGGKSNVHLYDLESGVLIRKYEVQNENELHFFNDIKVLASGAAYITDTYAGAIYKMEPSTWAIEEFIKSDRLQYCNGITASPDEKKLIVSTHRGLISVDVSSKEINRIDAQGYLVIADGLYQHKNSLIAIQNVFFPISVVQFKLDPTLNSITEPLTLVVDHPVFDVPTTGVVVDDYFYFIANSQMMNREGGKIKSAEMLKEVVIMRTRVK